MNAGFLSKVTQLVHDPALRARIFAVATTGDPRQHGAFGASPVALNNARVSHDAAFFAQLHIALNRLAGRAR
jgi:hypothetical protein